MTPLLRNRNALIAVCAAVLLLMVCVFRATRPVQIGNFALTTPSGWTQKFKRTSGYEEAIYEKKDGSIKFAVYFKVRLDRTTDVPATSQALQAEAAKYLPESVSLVQSMGSKFQYGAPQPKTISGMPAAETQTLVTSSSFTLYGRSIDFVSGSRLYGVYATVITPPTSATSPPAYLAAERDEALATITNNLLPAS